MLTCPSIPLMPASVKFTLLLKYTRAVWWTGDGVWRNNSCKINPGNTGKNSK